MKKNQFNITDRMNRYKSDLPEWTWGDIINAGLLLARTLDLPKDRRYKGLYWLSQKDVKELIAYN